MAEDTLKGKYLIFSMDRELYGIEIAASRKLLASNR